MSVPFIKAFLINHLESRQTEERFFSTNKVQTLPKISETLKTNGGRGTVLPPERVKNNTFPQR